VERASVLHIATHGVLDDQRPVSGQGFQTPRCRRQRERQNHDKRNEATHRLTQYRHPYCEPSNRHVRRM
jgi:hypothetical protein